MGRAALSWSRQDLATAADLGVATVVRFETGQPVSADSVTAMRAAMEAKRVKFVDEGPFAGAVVGGFRPA